MVSRSCAEQPGRAKARAGLSADLRAPVAQRPVPHPGQHLLAVLLQVHAGRGVQRGQNVLAEQALDEPGEHRIFERARDVLVAGQSPV
ncbi:hypothetical protein A6A27_31495 [Micromonospora sp. CB01531]|nr:hypothetical protein [Micromonospora sp. CB01531]OKI54853.1 hypothetical protein A6A27_31495 [Micromonospora sp. CB01531]